MSAHHDDDDPLFGSRFGDVDCDGVYDASTTISTGISHTCVLGSGGSVHCWGIDGGSGWDYGQVSDTPIGKFVRLSTGNYHNCGLDSSGSVECWGYDF